MSNSNIEIKKFSDFNLSENLLKALDSVGYEVPTPIQSEIIPHVLEGKDVLGQAQTGTGKTAAFALPLLSKIQISKNHPQVLVLTPTRELAIQVSEAFQKYASFIQNFHVMPVYGGQGYDLQLKQLRRGVHVVVGTPGRVMDHIKRKTLKLDNLKTIVLDEADEMLRMGFIDDVNWIMEQTPEDRQVALFSATMPAEIKNIAKKYQKDPIEISIKVKTSSAETIRQRYWFVKDVNKLDALTRILESENIDGVIIFVRTKTESSELSDRLRARGFLCDAINGDLPQKQRERTVENLKSKKLDILIATDVAARGLDVERISHVINYDIPYDTESYIHRIGRTGRAGRSGEAILFVSPREKKMLHIIQKATGKTIDEMMLPSHEDVNDLKLSRLSVKVMEKIEKEDLTQFNNIIENIKIYNNTTEKDIASAIALMLYEKDSKLFPHIFGKKKKEDNSKEVKTDMNNENLSPIEEGMERYKLEIGNVQKVSKEKLISIMEVEAGLEEEDIGLIQIFDSHTYIDLPEGMPGQVFKHLKKVKIGKFELKISKLEGKKSKPEQKKPSRDNKENSSKRRRPKNSDKDFNVNSRNKRRDEGKKKRKR